MYISAEKIAKKIIELFANNQAILASAKNLADGLQYSLDRRGIDIPEDLMVSSSEYQERITNGARITKQ